MVGHYLLLCALLSVLPCLASGIGDSLYPPQQHGYLQRHQHFQVFRGTSVSVEPHWGTCGARQHESIMYKGVNKTCGNACLHGRYPLEHHELPQITDGVEFPLCTGEFEDEECFFDKSNYIKPEEESFGQTVSLWIRPETDDYNG